MKKCEIDFEYINTKVLLTIVKIVENGRVGRERDRITESTEEVEAGEEVVTDTVLRGLKIWARR